MSANRRGGSSHLLGTLKTLITYITKVEVDNRNKRDRWIRSEEEKLLCVSKQTLAAATEANMHRHIKRKKRKRQKQPYETFITLHYRS